MDRSRRRRALGDRQVIIRACYHTAEGDVVVSSAYGSKRRAPGNRNPEKVAEELLGEIVREGLFVEPPNLTRKKRDSWKS